MADEPANKAKRKKRLVKNPETFRERALKAAETEDKPRRGAKVASAASRPFKTIFRPIGRGLRKIGSLKIFRWLRRPLRLIGKILLPPYFRNSWKELKLVTWPSWQQSRQLTVAVLVFAIVFGATIALVDYGLDKVFRNLLLK